MATRAKSNTTTDHETIRNWVEARGARPARVRSTAGADAGKIRFDFSGADESLEDIAWDEWFAEFDQGGLALVYEDKLASGEQSNFSKLIPREAAASPRRKRKSAPARQRAPKRRVASQGRKQAKTSAGGTRRATAGTSRITRAKAATKKAPSTRSKTQTKATGRKTGRKAAEQAPVARGGKVISIQSHARKTTHGRGKHAA